MRQVEVQANVVGRTAAEIYPIISNFKGYPKHSSAVRNVTIIEENENRTLSNWEVNFRQGILKWTEADYFSPENFSIRFQQIEGDAEHFSGTWLLTDTEKGCLIQFIAEFDMGIPSLSDIIEPIAEQALEENIESILRGLLREQVEFVD